MSDEDLVREFMERGRRAQAAADQVIADAASAQEEEVCASCHRPPEQGVGWLAHTGGRHMHASCEAKRQLDPGSPHDYEPADLAHRPPEEV